MAVADEQIPALAGRRLPDHAEPRVVEHFVATVETDSHATIGSWAETAIPAKAIVATLGTDVASVVCDSLARAVAPVDAPGLLKPLQRRQVALESIALAEIRVRNEAEPFQVVMDAALELDPGTFAVVILETEVHRPPEGSRQSPDVDRIDDVAQV